MLSSQMSVICPGSRGSARLQMGALSHWVWNKTSLGALTSLWVGTCNIRWH